MSIFLKLFHKNPFFTIYIHISKDRNSLINCSIDQIFFSTGSEHSNHVFCSFRSIQMSIFLDLLQKKKLPFIYIFQRAVIHSKIVRLTRFFSTGSEHSNEVFLFFESYHFLKIMKRKCQKTEFRGGHLGFLAAILD